MQRFVVFAWDCRVSALQPRADALAAKLISSLPEFRCVHFADGLRVFRAGDGGRSCETYEFRDNRGLVIGKLFRRDSEASLESSASEFGELESKRIAETAGRRLVDRYWGRYVALIHDRTRGAIHVLRDPTGAMPCQQVELSGVQLFFSHVTDCFPLGLRDRSINWDHVARFLWFHRLVTPDTGLAGISYVRAGECMTVADGQLRSTFYWSPSEICAGQAMDNRAEAARELSSCIRDCVTTWSSCYESILHRLSGGLDSAVVLACLASRKTRSRVIAQNLYAPGAEGDERQFARAAAQRADIELCETLLEPSNRPIETVLETPPVVSPAMTQLILEETQSRDELIRRHSVDAVFSGQGGDHLFQRTATRQIAVEYAARNGLRPGLLGVVAETARFTNKSFWSVIAAIIADAGRRRRFDPYAEQFRIPPFLSAATRDAVDIRQLRHPWVDDADRLPSAKMLQIVETIDSQNFHITRYPQVDVVHPLISQPIIELCLRIPTYVLTYGGRDRALVRDAFREQLPAKVFRRTSKGGTTRYVFNYLLANLSPIRELLLDGALIENSILDRRATETCLTEARLVRDPTLLFPILNCLRAEAWLKAWMRPDRQAVD